MSHLSGLRGIEFRRVPDLEGDTSVCLIMFVKDEKKVDSFVEAVQAEGIEAAGIYNKGIPDWHVYHHWRILLDKRMPTAKGCPFNCPVSGPSPTYPEDAFPATREWLRRSVHLDIPPQLSREACDQIGEGIRKVAEALL